MTKILLVTSRSDEGGGPEQALAIARLLGDQHEFWVALPQEGAYWSRFVRLLGESRVIPIEHRAVRFADIARLRRIIVRESIDIVHTHGKGAGVVARLVPTRKSNFVHTFHGLHTGHMSRASLFVYRMLERSFYRRTAQTIAVSDSEAASLMTFLNTQNGIATVLNGVATTGGPNRNDQPRLPLKAVSVLRANEQKNPEEALRIFAGAESAGLVESLSIICPSDDVDEITRLAAVIAPGKKINIVGPVPSCSEIIGESTVLINSSRWEGLPLTPLEALAAGTPVILSDVVGNSDILDRIDSAIGYQLGDVESAVGQLARIQAPDVWRTLSHDGRIGVEACFSETAMASATAAVYAAAQSAGVRKAPALR